MADQEKPFICTKRGWQMNITPRNAEGWQALAVWVIPFLGVTALYVAAIARAPESPMAKGLTILFVAGSLIWAAAMVRWMYLRSEIIELPQTRRRGWRR